MYKMALDVLVCIYVYNIYYICRYAYLYIYIYVSCILISRVITHFGRHGPSKSLMKQSASRFAIDMHIFYIYISLDVHVYIFGL